MSDKKKKKQQLENQIKKTGDKLNDKAKANQFLEALEELFDDDENKKPE